MNFPQLSLDQVLTILASLMPVIVWLLMVAYRLVLEHLPAAKRAQAEKDVAMLVTAVEQVFKNAPGSGAQKKMEVLRLAHLIGIPASDTVLNLLIESTVAALPTPPAAPSLPTLPPSAGMNPANVNPVPSAAGMAMDSLARTLPSPSVVTGPSGPSGPSGMSGASRSQNPPGGGSANRRKQPGPPPGTIPPGGVQM